MKNIKKLAIVGGLGLALCGLAIAAQVHRAGGFRHVGSHRHGDAASIAKHLGEAFPRFAPFDTNKDSKLDEAERKAIAEAISNGTLELPTHRPPDGVAPTTERLVDHIAEVFAIIAQYDANQDSQFDEAEQAAVKAAIEEGALDLHKSQ